MKKISAALAVLALVAAEPAFAGCGSHGGGGYSGYSSYRARTVRAPVVVRKVVKRDAPQSKVRTAAVTTTSTTATATADKPEATARVVSSASALGAGVVESTPAKTAQTPTIECKEYSAALGEMITVPCS